MLFNSAGRALDQPVITVKNSEKRKAKSKLHTPYEKHKLNPILDYLKVVSPNLYICCLLTYSSWLRPHEEIRLLTCGDFKKDYTEVHLTGGDHIDSIYSITY